MKILHIVRNLSDGRAIDTARGHQGLGHDTTLLLLHDAVLSRPSFAGRIYACQDDVAARGGGCPFPTVDYDQIVRLIFEHDRVIAW